jgi:hypothetical protein
LGGIRFIQDQEVIEGSHPAGDLADLGVSMQTPVIADRLR